MYVQREYRSGNTFLRDATHATCFHPRVLHQRLAWASCLLLACASTPTEVTKPSTEPTSKPASGAAADAARAFQIEYERELRADEHSFLTVVAAHYLAPGRQLRLAWDGSTWAPSDDGGIAFEPSAEAMLVEQGAGVQRIEDRGVIPVDGDARFSFMVSRQESDWRVLVHDRDAPLRREFPGTAWFPIDATAIIEAQFEARATREPSVVQTSRGVTKTLYVAGEASFELQGRSLRLLVFGYAPEPAPDEPLIIPFRDETTGHESYATDRYLEPTLPVGGQLLLDFNRATNPLCAYSEHYNCPMPPRFNTLSVAIRAGAMAPESH
jgi:uncharacterized protein (DUF1684 family)